MAEFVEDMAFHIDDQSLGTLAATSGWAVFRDGLPVDPDTAISVQGSGGSTSEGQFGDTALKYEHPTAQILVRATRQDVSTARNKAFALYKLLGAIVAATVNGTFYHRVTCLQPPFLVQFDKDEVRPIFVFNIRGDKEVAA